MNRLRTLTTATCAFLLTLTACERPASAPQPAPGGPAPAPAAAAAKPEAAKPADSVTPTSPSAGEQAALDKFVSENAAPAPAVGNLPPGHPPIEGAAPARPAPAPQPPAGAAELKFETPAGWTASPPRSAMRKAQYALPKAEGDAEDGELVVFYFGPGEGGGVEDNLARWRGMFTTLDGQPLPADAMTREHFDANGLKVTMMDVAGRYAPSAMPGMPATGPKDDYRMLAAVIETPGGPWFLRAVGPQKTMAAHRDAFKQFLSSAQQ